MSEESRLGRESIEVAYALKAFVQAGVRRVPVPRYAQVSTKKQQADIARYLEGGA